MKPFFDRGGNGYIVDDAAQACKYCAFKVGEQFYAAFNMSFDNRWRDLGIFAAFIVSNLIILFLAVSADILYLVSIFVIAMLIDFDTVSLLELQPAINTRSDIWSC
jgi:hypothetical protein